MMTTELDFRMMELADQISEAIRGLDEFAFQPDEPDPMKEEPDVEPPFVRPRRKRRRRQNKKGDPEVPSKTTIPTGAAKDLRKDVTAIPKAIPFTQPLYSYSPEDFPPLTHLTRPPQTRPTSQKTPA